MAKKTKKTDWKFFIILGSILLLGLSVLALNQKTTYRSDAATLDDCGNARTDCEVGPKAYDRETDTQRSNRCTYAYTQCAAAIGQCSEMKQQCIDSNPDDTGYCDTNYANCLGGAGGASKKNNCIVVGTAKGTRTVCGKTAVKREFNRLNKMMGW